MAFLITTTDALCPLIPESGSKFTWQELVGRLWTINGRYWVYELGEDLLIFNPEGYDMQHAINAVATTLAQERFPSAEIYGVALYLKADELKERRVNQPIGLPKWSRKKLPVNA